MKFFVVFIFCLSILNQFNAKSIPKEEEIPNSSTNESIDQSKNLTNKNSLQSFVMGLFDMTTRFIEKDGTFKELNAKFEKFNSELIPKIKNMTDDIVNSKIDLKTAANDFISNISNEFKSRQQSFRFRRSAQNNRWSNGDAIRNFFERIIQSVKDTHKINDMNNFYDLNTFYRAK